MAIPAVVILLSIVFTWFALLLRLHQEPDWMVPIAAAFALPIVRLGHLRRGADQPGRMGDLGIRRRNARGPSGAQPESPDLATADAALLSVRDDV